MVFLIVGFIVLAIVFGPMVTIFALNTLFGLSIPVTLATWFSVLWLSAMLAQPFKSKE